MKKGFIVGAAMVFGAIGVARADVDIIKLRQATFALNGAAFAGIQSEVAAKGDMKPVVASAKAIAKWAALIPTAFPTGSDKGDDTKALPEIWSDPTGFAKDAADLGAAATKLAELAQGTDMDAIAAQVKAVGGTCGACHRAYRAK